MKVTKEQDKQGKITGYMMYLSARETGDWARKAGAVWPCSVIKDERLWVAVDDNGLYDYSLNGTMIDLSSNELEAIVTDHLPNNCKHLWPCWS